MIFRTTLQKIKTSLAESEIIDLIESDIRQVLLKLNAKFHQTFPHLSILNYFFKNRSQKYRFAAILDILLIGFIAINAIGPIQRIIPPLVSPLYTAFHPLTPVKTTSKMFAFAPGSSFGKMGKIDFSNLDTLSYYDVPIDEDGNLYTTSTGYKTFKDPKTAEMFDKAHAYGTKVSLTISSTNNQTITKFLNNRESQLNLSKNIIAEINDSKIDGVTIDFEYKGSEGSNLRNKYVSFISLLKQEMNASASGSELAVAVNGPRTSEDFYNSTDLAQFADKIFVIASDFAVTEVVNNEAKTPKYGYDEGVYWGEVGDSLTKLTRFVPEEKLVMERAWYGNGDNYPMYVPNGRAEPKGELKDVSSVLDQKTLDRLVEGVPNKAKAAARKNIPYVAAALEQEGILDSNVLAYALATIEHETADTFEPIEEIQGSISARRLGYEGGTNYYGRGFIQLTHLRNYRMVGERIGMGEELARNPELASRPDVAAKVLAAFFKDNNVANLASKGNFVAARKPVNPDRYAYQVAYLASKYE